MQALNMKDLYGIETRDNKGNELTWAEMDKNLKLLSLSSFMADDISHEFLKPVGEKLLAIQNTDFILYTNEGGGENGSTLDNKIDEEILAAFDELDNLNYNESVMIVIPFMYLPIGEGLDGTEIKIRNKDINGNKWVEYMLYDKKLLSVGYGSNYNDPYQFLECGDLEDETELILILEVYWD